MEEAREITSSADDAQEFKECAHSMRETFKEVLCDKDVADSGAQAQAIA
jgi:hypothetical protein